MSVFNEMKGVVNKYKDAGLIGFLVISVTKNPESGTINFEVKTSKGMDVTQAVGTMEVAKQSVLASNLTNNKT